MLFNLKKQKGSTIVEVLVSVIIIGIVSVYGMSFFASAYKHALDSKDYDFILHDLVRKMEMVKAGGRPLVSDDNYFPPVPSSAGQINSGNNDKTIYDFKVDKDLRKNCKVHYTCKVYANSRTENGVTDNFDNSTQIVVEATWPWPTMGTPNFDDENEQKKKNKIVLVTYMSDIWPFDSSLDL